MEKLKRLILDAMFPPECFGCGSREAFFCPECRQKIIVIKKQTCPICKRQTVKGEFCHKCAKKTKLKGVISFGYFKDPIIQKAIISFKYHELWGIKYELAEIAAPTIKGIGLTFDLVSYVPQTFKRKAIRGYNQSEMLAKELSLLLNIPFARTLYKKVETYPQAVLGRRDRLINLQNSFVRNKKIDLSNKKILLIDDVVTTGSTLSECAKVLRESGAKSVWGFVVAKD
jgi:ComF family protein